MHIVYTNSIEQLHLRHEYDVIITSVWQKAFSLNVIKAQPVHFLDYYYRLEAKMKARYLRKLACIKSEDPYVLNTSDLCKDVSRLPALG